MSFEILQANARHLPLAGEIGDSCVTDPPYELGFMGKVWDKSGVAYDPAAWREVLRVLKPGAHLVAFGGTRTYHRMAVAIEDAGFEIRDQLQWIYGSGFPKSLDVSKAIDRMAGAGRVITGFDEDYARRNVNGKYGLSVSGDDNTQIRSGIKPITAPATDEAAHWNGWGTALKPANEPICLARKPLEKGLTVAQNVLKWGTGALNIGACRIEHQTINGGNLADNPHLRGTKLRSAPVVTGFGKAGDETSLTSQNGRWPANVIHDGSDEVLAHFPETSSGLMKGGTSRAAQDEPGSICYGTYGGNATDSDTFADSGSAARFFYCAKADKSDRGNGNHHPTVKPTDLMQYLCRLVTPPGGLILDPFVGSGSTGKAALVERFRCIGLDINAEYLPIIGGRVTDLQVNLI